MKTVKFAGAEWLVEDWAKWIASDRRGVGVFSEKPDWHEQGYWTTYNLESHASELHDGYFSVELMEIE